MIRFVTSLLVAIGLLGSFSAQANPYLDAFKKAQPIIKASVEAYGGIERLQGIETLGFDIEGENFLRYQSEKLGPPFESQPNTQTYTVNFATNELKIENGGANFNNIALSSGEKSYQMNPDDNTYTEGEVIDVGEHHIHRIVPALLIRKLYERANTVLWIGESEVKGMLCDTLAITWPNGAQYAVHIDRKDHLIRQYDILFPDPILGDEVFANFFGEYKMVDGIPFAGVRAQTIAGEKVYTMLHKNVSLNADLGDVFELPSTYTLADTGDNANDATPEFETLGEGVYLAGGNYRTLFIDLGDEVIAVDAGGQPVQAQEKITRLREEVGDKPLSTVVLTHHHSDHIQAVGQYVAEGATVMTNKANREYITKAVTVRYAGANVTNAPESEPKFSLIKDRATLNGDLNTVEIYRVANGHAREYYVAYVPKIKLLYSADVFGFPMNGTVPATSDDLREFGKNLAKRKLDIELVANAHGRTASYKELADRLTAE